MLRNQAKYTYLVSLDIPKETENKKGEAERDGQIQRVTPLPSKLTPPVTFTGSQTTSLTDNSIFCHIPSYQQCDGRGWIKQPLSWVSTQLMEPCEEASLRGWVY